MDFAKVEVTAADGQKKKAQMCECIRCRNNEFIIFIIEGHDHPHLQCARCGCSHCYMGACK